MSDDGTLTINFQEMAALQNVNFVQHLHAQRIHYTDPQIPGYFQTVTVNEQEQSITFYTSIDDDKELAHDGTNINGPPHHSADWFHEIDLDEQEPRY